MADLLFQVPCTLHFKIRGESEAMAQLKAQLICQKSSEIFVKFNDPRLTEGDALLSFKKSDIPERTK